MNFVPNRTSSAAAAAGHAAPRNPAVYRITIDDLNVRVHFPSAQRAPKTPPFVARAPFQEPLLSARERRRRCENVAAALTEILRHRQYLLGGCDDAADDAEESLDREEAALVAELVALRGTGCFRRGRKVSLG